MHALEDIGTFHFSNEDENDGEVAEINNLETTIQVSPTATTRIHKDHPLDQVIGDLHSATQTRNMSKNLEEHRLFLAYASFKDFVVYQMDVKSAFLYGKIEEEVYVYQPPGFEDPDSPDRVYKEHVTNEAIHKERGGRLVRVGTTASSLEVEQDSGNINKTQSKAIHNEASSLGTTSGGGPRCQEAIGDTISQTRTMYHFIIKGSGLGETNTTQALEITSFKRRVKKLEKKQRSRTHKLKRLYKFGLTARVDSSEDEPNLGEDATKQWRIKAINADEDITLVNDQNDADDAEMFDVYDLHGEHVFFEKDDVDNEVNDEVQKVADEVVEDTITTKLIIDAAQVNVAEEPVKPKKKDQIRLDEKAALKLQVALKAKKIFDKSFKRVNTFEPISSELVKGSSKRVREEIEQERSKKQKVDDDKETTKLKKLMEIIPNEEEVAIDAIPLAVKSPKIIDWKIHKEGKKSYYQIIRVDENSKMYIVFYRMLKEFDREDLEDLYSLVKEKYGSIRPVEDLDLLLWGDLNTMFEPHVEYQVWKKQHGYKVLEWKLYDSCGVHSLRMKSVHIYVLVENKYPLTAPTLTDMLSNKLKIDYQSKMAYQGRIVGIKSHLNAVGITVAHIDVITALMKLVLLKLPAAQDKVSAAQELQENILSAYYY
nr:putative ribonuclease H-like domain-containing protein [Tanacetum cinerariifolium]